MNVKLANSESLGRKKVRLFSTQPFYLFAIIVFVGIIMSIVNPNFLTGQNLLNIFIQDSVTGIIAMASTIVLISGGIDLSVGQMMSLSCCVIAKAITLGISPALAVCLGFIVATGCGLFTGAIIALTKCPPFIITLGMEGVFGGVALMIAQGKIINIPISVQLLGSGKIGFIPVSVIIFIATCLVVYFILSRLRLGRRLYAIGGNEETAYYSGVRVTYYKMIVYAFGGMLVALASVVLLVRLGSANAVMGKGYALQAIAAAVIGGVSLNGGKGSIIGAFFGVLLLGVISNAMNILGISPFSQEVVLGSIIVLAVITSNMGKGKR
jgi:ribose/xylose/arabinose/galactoside ABC-type transport system permease subunit